MVSPSKLPGNGLLALVEYGEGIEKDMSKGLKEGMLLNTEKGWYQIPGPI